MTESFPRPQLAVTRDRTWTFLGAIGSVVILLNGCAAQKRPAILWSTAVRVRPVIPPHPADTATGEEAAPDLRIEIPAPLAPLATRAAPARPRTPASPNPSAATGKPETPQIVPELSTQESASLRQETNQSLAVADHNLGATAGKSLNAAQADLASKVRSFISDSREAGRVGDWARARDLAQKAQVLSEELARSL